MNETVDIQSKFIEKGITLEKQEKELSYWKERLAGYGNLDLPTDYPRPKQISGKGGQVQLMLPGQEAKALKRLCQEKQATLLTVFMASVYLLLRRYSRQEDICLGTPMVNRNHQEIENLGGFFVNTLVIRIDTEAQPETTVEQLLKKVHEEIVEAQDHQNVPFEKVMEALQPARDSSRTPIFHVLVNDVNTKSDELQGGDITLEELERDNGISKFDLTFELADETDGGVGINLKYRRDLYKEESIERLGGHLVKIMTSLTEEPGQAIDEIELLTNEEKHQLLIEWNDTAAQYPKDKCIHELFEEQVKKTPDNVAVVFEDRELTYQELNERSTNLAVYLQKQGVKPESLVGICVERSLEMIVGILGILKAGGAYVPIDPEYPEARIRYMLEDSGVKILLTQEKLEEKVSGLPGHKDDKVLAIDKHWAEIEKIKGQLAKEVNCDNLAYVIYTSGSTGKPKGVMVEHRSILNTLYALQSRYPMTVDDTYLGKTNYVFDVSIAELFGWFIGEGRLAILKPGEEKDPLAILKALSERRVTHVNFVPSMFATFVDMVSKLDLKACKDLKYVMVAGEAFPRRLADESHMKFDQAVRIENIYGPTEISIYGTWFSVRGIKHTFQQVPIGTPLYNVQAYILSQGGVIQPIGVPGELHICGDGLARGYLNQPELTREKFIDNPFNPGTKMYKTGDLARWLPDGNIEFLGRLDHQVKIRGFRIELEEIEGQLLNHKDITDAVVMARQASKNANDRDRSLEKYLCAYFISEKELGVAELQEYLSQALPDYMIPSFFIRLKSIPLTTSGKVDKKVLPEPEVKISYVAPTSEDEVKLCKIWEELFGLKPIGIRDNLFNLGGNSLLVARLINRVKESFGRVISFSGIYENPTIKALADKIRSLNREESEFTSIRRLNKKSNIPLSIQQEQVWFLCTLVPDNKAYNFQFTLRFRGKFNKRLFESCLTEIIRRHEILRTTFPTVQGKPVQMVHEPWEAKISVADLRGVPGKEEREHLLQEAIEQELDFTFDFTKLPLIRFKVFLLDEEEFLFLQIEHHFVHDGWSNAVYLQELKVLYETYSKGEKSPLPELTVQFSDFAIWQREWLEGDSADRHLNYWLKQLHECPDILELSSDKPRPNMQSFNGDLLRIHVPDDLYQGLRAFCCDKETTLFVTLYSAFSILLHLYTDQEDMLVGTALVNRRSEETTHLIGMFVNAIVLRTRVSGELMLADLLESVQEVVLQAYEHQETPIGKIVERLFSDREPSRNPLFQVMFSFHDSPVPDVEFSDLSAEYRIIHNETSKTDLNVICLPRAEQRIGMDKTERQERLEILWEYNSDIFNRETMERMTNYYFKILEDILNKNKLRVSDIEIIDETNKRKILSDFNDTAAEYPKDKCIHELFEEQVKQKPDNDAVFFEGQKLTYRELDEKSTTLAVYLQKHGVKPDSLVGICAERSLEMMVGILGILKAGGAYVPIDPEYPEARIKYMLEDSGVKILLTPQKLEEKVSGLLLNDDSKIIAVDKQWVEIAAGKGKLEREVRPNHLAYVIYTSGSTGKPKGVMVEHQAICNRIVWMQKQYDLNQMDRVLQKTPFSFDVSVWEFLWPIMAGAKLIFVLPDKHKDGKYLANFIEEQKITTLHFVPSMLQSFLAVENLSDKASSIKRIICSGEALSKNVQDDCLTKLDCELHNLYGPTEAAVDVTYWKCDREYQWSVPIGRPIYNTQIYILSNRNQARPIGVPGELHIAGAGLARGYLNQPDLTAEKFINNPFNPGARMYKTGDLARWLPDGNIEFLGRMDHQVKVRGYRIELGEIEAVMREQEGVAESVVVMPERGKDEKLMVGYFVPDKKNAGKILKQMKMEKEGELKEKRFYQLRNGMEIAHLNVGETEAVYEEIFEEEEYLRHGITIEDEDCIFDVGGNIGLFTLYVTEKKEDVQVYAFEPIPDVYEVMRINTEMYGRGVKIYNFGLSNESGEEKFTYYPHVTIVSGGYGNQEEERKTVRAYILKEESRKENREDLKQDEIEEILEKRLKSKQVKCRLKTISEVLKVEGIERVDFLKIDVEKMEKKVLEGIEERDWGKIKQIVVEVHDIENRVAELRQLFKGKGYEVTIEQQSNLEEAGLYNVYAKRRIGQEGQKSEGNSKQKREKDDGGKRWYSKTLLIKEIEARLRKRLPDYMIPTVLIAIEETPLMPNGKIDRKTLMKREVELESSQEYVAPQTETEQELARIWEEVLGVKKVGIYHNFFKLGGHSLLANQIISRINQKLAIQVPLRRLFEAPNIKKLSLVVGESQPCQPVPITSIKRPEQLFNKPGMARQDKSQTKSSNSTRKKEQQEIPELTEDQVEEMLEKFQKGELSLEEIERFL